MSSAPRNSITKFLIIIFVLPIFLQGQTGESEVEVLQAKVDELSKMLTELQSEQSQSNKVDVELDKPRQKSPQSEKQRLKALHRKQAASRARIDAITQDIIELSKQLEDPRKRYALAKKLQAQSNPKQKKSAEGIAGAAFVPDKISARSIDLVAVKLVREGKSLDQARLLTIDQLTSAQVLAFYRDLTKESRYELYDIADEIAETEGVELDDARQSAIYFFLFAK